MILWAKSLEQVTPQKGAHRRSFITLQPPPSLGCDSFQSKQGGDDGRIHAEESECFCFESAIKALRIPEHSLVGLQVGFRVLWWRSRTFRVHHSGLHLYLYDHIRNVLGCPRVACSDSCIHLLLCLLWLGQGNPLSSVLAFRGYPEMSCLSRCKLA